MALKTADVAQMTFLTEDEKRWLRHERAKRRKKPDPPKAHAGACCARCDHWDVPEAGEKMGTCAALVMPMEGRREDRAIMPVAEARMRGLDRYDPLRTAPGFGCRSFRGPSGETREETVPPTFPEPGPLAALVRVERPPDGGDPTPWWSDFPTTPPSSTSSGGSCRDGTGGGNEESERGESGDPTRFP